MAAYHHGIYNQFEQIPHLKYSLQQDIFNKNKKVQSNSDNLYSVYNQLKSDGNFTIILSMIDKVPFMKNILSDSRSQVTFFAAPDSAFYKLPSHMWREIDINDAQSIITFHTVKGIMTTKDMESRRFFAQTYHQVENLLINGLGLTVKVGLRHHSSTSNPTINYHSKIIGYDLPASNGVIQIISVPVLPIIV